jgi:hypothetical protein
VWPSPSVAPSRCSCRANLNLCLSVSICGSPALAPALPSRRSGRGAVGHEHDLADHASLREQLLRAFCLGKWNALRDERFDFLLMKKFEQRGQILPEQIRLQSFQRLDAVGDDSLPAGEKPAARNEEREQGNSVKAVATAPWWLEPRNELTQHTASPGTRLRIPCHSICLWSDAATEESRCSFARSPRCNTRHGFGCDCQI